MDMMEVPPAVAQGGPMDGKVLGSADAASFEIVMADRSRWDYVATAQQQVLLDGSRATVYLCRGRV